MPDIKCNVTECSYNKNVKCSAPMVQIDYNGSSDAQNSSQTKCETFKKS
ncbi:MAG: DUF1540 domain-containing protein [Thermacetogeniaceae bacterium]